MKAKLLTGGILALLMSSCTVVYQARPGSGYASNNAQYPDQYYDPYQGDDLDGYDQSWDADTSAGEEPKIDFNSNAYDNGYVYNPAYFGANFYAGNPFWGLGLYSGWGWGTPWGWGSYSPWGWGIGIGYGWGGYYGWGSIYTGWGGYYGWPGYGGYWGYPYYGWGGGYYGGWGYSPYIVRRATRHSNLVTRDGQTFVRTSAANRWASGRDMNVSNTRGVRSYRPSIRQVSNNQRSYDRRYSPTNRSYTEPRNSNVIRRTTPTRTYQTPPSRTRSYTPPTRSYSPPARSYTPSRSSAPTRSYSPPARSGGGGGATRSTGGGRSR